MADAPEEIVDELYGAPFDEFVARRDAHAKELRREKRREEADAVKALRKPALSAWGIDQLARRERDRLDGLLAAGAALRQAKGGDALRDATHEERDAVEELAERAAELMRDAGQQVTDKTAGELRDTLHAAALDDETREAIERGRLVEPRQAIGLAGFGAPAEPEERGQRAEGRGQKRKRDAPKQDDRAARRERAKAAREALRDAEQEQRERERDVRAAEREEQKRERELAEAESALDAARRAADAARDALEEAGDAVERRRTELDEASG